MVRGLTGCRPCSRQAKWPCQSHSELSDAQDVHAARWRDIDLIRTHDSIPMNFAVELIIHHPEISSYVALTTTIHFISYRTSNLILVNTLNDLVFDDELRRITGTELGNLLMPEVWKIAARQR